MYKNNLSTKHSIPIKQVSSNNQTIKKNTYDNYTILRRTVFSLIDENKKLINRIDLLEKVILQKDFSDLININELQNINIINGTCNDINNESLDNSIVNKKYVDLCLEKLNNTIEFKNNSSFDINCLIPDNILKEDVIKINSENNKNFDNLETGIKSDKKQDSKTDKKQDSETDKKQDSKSDKSHNFDNEDKELLQNLADELNILQKGIQDIQQMNTFDNSKTLELFSASPSMNTQHNINIGYNPKNKSSKITLNASIGDIYCSSINKLLGNLSIGKNIVINYNGNIKCNNIDSIGDVNVLKNLTVKENIKCNNIILSNIKSETLNVKNGEITEINQDNPKSLINIEYLDSYPRNYYVETITNNLSDNYKKNDLIFYQNDNILTLMKFDGKTFNKVNVKNGSLCIVDNTEEIYMKLKDKNDNQNWVKYLIEKSDENNEKEKENDE